MKPHMAEHEPIPVEWPRYARVLAALDDSPLAPFVLRHVVPYVVQERSQLTLLTVLPRPSPTTATAGVSPEDLAQNIDAAGSTLLRRLAAALPHDLSVTTLVRHGDAAEQILAVIEEGRHDLVCIGARGRGRVTSALLGSVSGAVMRSSPVPVVVLHPPRGRA
jgi:universal stress protein A